MIQRTKLESTRPTKDSCLLHVGCWESETFSIQFAPMILIEHTTFTIILLYFRYCMYNTIEWALTNQEKTNIRKNMSEAPFSRVAPHILSENCVI